MNAIEMSSPVERRLDRLGRLRVVALAGLERDLAVGERQPHRGVALGDQRDALDGLDQRGGARRRRGSATSSGNSERTFGVVAVDQQRRGPAAAGLEADQLVAPPVVSASVTSPAAPSALATSDSVRARTSATLLGVRGRRAATCSSRIARR